MPPEGVDGRDPADPLAVGAVVEGLLPAVPVEGPFATVPVEGRFAAVPVAGREATFWPLPELQPRASRVLAEAVPEPLVRIRFWSGFHCCDTLAFTFRELFTFTFRLTLLMLFTFTFTLPW